MTKRYHHGDLRAALVEAARRVVERDGPDAVTLRGVAQAVGVSQAAPYHHFKDKRALLSAVAAAGFRDFARTMVDRAAEAADPRDRLLKLGVGYVDFAVSSPALFRLMQGPALQPDEAVGELAEARVASGEPLVEAVKACLPGASEAQVRTACAAAWSIVHGMATLFNDGRLGALVNMEDVDGTAERIARLLDVDKVLDG